MTLAQGKDIEQTVTCLGYLEEPLVTVREDADITGRLWFGRLDLQPFG
jgi:hypothetical protein